MGEERGRKECKGSKGECEKLVNTEARKRSCGGRKIRGRTKGTG